MAARIQVDRAALARFCESHGIRELSLFGSVLRDDCGPDSDVDVLVEFEPAAQVGLLAYCGMIEELESLFGRK